jgi:hypothetical protein
MFNPAPTPATRARAFDLPSSQVHRLGAADLEVLEGFFARRLDFSLQTREKLAERIATVVRAKTELQVPAGISTETFLEEIASQLRDLARIA